MENSMALKKSIFSKPAVKEKKRENDKKLKKLQAEILNDLAVCKNDIIDATRSFHWATDPLLIDLYCYEINAAKARYRYLMNCAKKAGISNDITEPGAMHINMFEGRDYQ